MTVSDSSVRSVGRCFEIFGGDVAFSGLSHKVVQSHASPIDSSQMLLLQQCHDVALLQVDAQHESV